MNAVIRITEYYQNDCQHPMGIKATIETYVDETGGWDMIGTPEECEKWLKEENNKPRYLGHGVAGYYHIICTIDWDDPDYQAWLDNQDWNGCPSEDGEDYDANCLWAEKRAIRNKKNMIVQDQNGRLYIVSEKK